MILDKIELRTKERVEENKKKKPLSVLKAEAVDMKNKKDPYRFEAALRNKKPAFICEVKKASPSKGVIASDFPYLDIAKEYEAAGANAISVLTEPYFFLGEDRFLEEISKNVSTPTLRKDFVVDEYMIYEAKLLGADAVLLICAILASNQLNEYYEIAKSLGMSVLVEAHDEEEVEMAISSGAKIIGVNNRDLKTFNVDLNNSINLSRLIPEDVIYVSESGIKTQEDIKLLIENRTNAVLIGETLMRSDRKKEILSQLRGD